MDYQTIFDVLQTDPEVLPLLGPFQTALKNKAMEQFEGMIGTLQGDARVALERHLRPRRPGKEGRHDRYRQDLGQLQ